MIFLWDIECILYNTVQYCTVHTYYTHWLIGESTTTPNHAPHKECKKKNLFHNHYIGKVSNDPVKFAFNSHLSTTSATYPVSHTVECGFSTRDLTSLLMQPCKSTPNKSNIFSWPLTSKLKFSGSHTPLHSKTPASPCITRKSKLQTALTWKRGCLPHILAMASRSQQWGASMCKATEEFSLSILRSYLLKEMPILEKCDLWYIFGRLLISSSVRPLLPHHTAFLSAPFQKCKVRSMRLKVSWTDIMMYADIIKGLHWHTFCVWAQ